jgi:mannose-6-phosphate isomerase-like protein (cupin superfamily)
MCQRCATGVRFPEVRIENLRQAEAFVTLDGSEIREVAGIATGDEERDVGPGDTVVIAPGVAHKLWCTGTEPLRLLCCCAPGYSDADTVITEPQD